MANFKVALTVELLFIEIEQKYRETLLPQEQIYILEKKLPLSYHFHLAIQILMPTQIFSESFFSSSFFKHASFCHV